MTREELARAKQRRWMRASAVSGLGACLLAFGCTGTSGELGAGGDGSGGGGSSAGSLEVDPTTAFASSGFQGGPFSPSSTSYALTNSGADPLDWTASSSALWVSVSSAGGTLAAGESTSVTVSIDHVLAGSLDVGPHASVVTFTNVASAEIVTRDVVLTVLQPVGGVTLVPGSGWTGSTTEPGQINGGTRYDTAKVIGRFDAAPYQLVSSPFNVGVVAFHANGIDRVEMSLDDGPWTVLPSATLNPRTGVVEYWATVDPSLFPQGVRDSEVRAIAYPKDGGRPRHIKLPGSIPGLPLTVDNGGSFVRPVMYCSPSGDDGSGDGSQSSPFRNIRRAAEAVQSARNAAGAGNNADGGLVYLMPGEYDFDDAGRSATVTTSRVWLTVTPAPGFSQADVSIVRSAGSSSTLPSNGLNLLHTKDVHWDGRSAVPQMGSGGGLSYRFWAEDCTFANAPQGSSSPGRWDTGGKCQQGNGWQGGYSPMYLTGCTIRDTRHAFQNLDLGRNLTLRRIAEDCFRNPRLLINIDIDDVKGANGWHPDVVITTNQDWKNQIVYGFRAVNCDAQGFIYGANTPGFTFSNIALVNVVYEGLSAGVGGRLTDINVDHWLMLGVTMDKNYQFRYVDDSGTRNIKVKGCFWRDLASLPGDKTGNSAPSLDDQDFISNHYESGSVFPGSDVTLGDAQFVDEGNDDYRPAPGSPLKGRVIDYAIPADVSGVMRGNPASVGGHE